MTNKWTNEEELNLVKDISAGIAFETISQKHGRSISAIELRLKKIIYVNACSGKSMDNISKLLKIPEDRVKQHYYSYKEFKEKHSKIIDDVKIPDIISVNNQHIVSNNLQSTKTHNTTCIQSGGNYKLEKIELKIQKLELENRLIKSIVENKDLTHKLNKLIKEGRVDKGVKHIIKVVRDSN